MRTALRLRFFATSGIAVPVHSHLTDLAVLRLTENRSPRVDLLSGPTAAERTAKFRREPRSRRIDLAGRKLRLGLMQRDVLPVRADRRLAVIRLAERCFEEHRVVGENRDDRLDIPALPSLSETVDQCPVALIHGRKYTRQMRRVALLFGLVMTACRPSADNGYSLLFLGRSSAARIGRISWAADAPRSRLIAFDGDLHVVKTITNPRLSSPVAVAPYPNSKLLITEPTGEGVVFDTAGQPVREWESPFPAALYATDGDHIYA